MEAILIILSIIFASATAVLALKLQAAKQFSEHLKHQIDELKISFQITQESERRLEENLENTESQKNEALIKKTEAETKLQSLLDFTTKTEQNLQAISDQKDQAIAEFNSQKQQTSLVMQQLKALKEETHKHKETEKRFMDYAKSSIMEAGSNLSSKLLDDHKRENEVTKKENEKIVKETTDNLHKQFKDVFESVSTLNERVSKSGQAVDLVKRSLLEPSGAGSLAEITLENIFKASGLIENQDYKMQYWVESENSGGLKPDAVVFLPGNNALVVDSKASKFFAEIASASDESEEKQASESLKKTMNKHLKDLVKRNYLEAIESQTGKVKATILMFLPSEIALDKLRNIDSKFTDNAWKERIIPVGPSGLVTMLINATTIISNAKQDENAQKIMLEIKSLLQGVIKMHEYASSLGKSLKTSLTHYDKFAGSFDRTFVSKAKKISTMGANMPKLQEVKKLERYIVKVDKKDYNEINGDATDEDTENNENALKELVLELE